MAYLKGFSSHNQNGFVNDKKSYYVPNSGGGLKTPYKDGWDVDRGVKQALDRVTWVYKSVYAIAANAARLPIGLRKGDWRIGELQWDSPILTILNRQANPGQDAFSFRFMLSSQLMLSPRGAFIEVIKNKMDEVVALVLLQPQFVFPIPDAEKFVSGFSVEYPGVPKRVIDAANVIWVRVPHPTDPYRGQTPLDAAGLAIEFDYYSRVYNRNFVVNDARPGGLLVVNGDMEDEQSEELKRRFSGSTGSNIGGAGRLTIMSADSAQFIDTATNQRDAQYSEARQQNKEEILIAFGVPESILGNASNRTFANADTELEVFWRETMIPHLTLIERALDRLDDDVSTFFSYDLSSVAILSRDDRERASFHLEELRQGAISIDEYRDLTGRKGVGITELLIPTNLSPVVMGGDGKIKPPSKPGDGQLLNPNQNPGQRPNNSPDKPVPSGAQQSPPPRGSDSIGPTNNPTPRPVFTPALTPLAQEVDESKTAEDATVRRLRQLERLEKSVGLQMGAFLKRQERVLLEKASSKKSKEKWNSAEKIKVEDIFDVSVWDEQIVDDAKTWMSSVFLDGAIELAEGKMELLDMGSLSLSEILDARMSNVKKINTATSKKISSIISQSAKSTHEEFIAELKNWLNESFSARVKTISTTEVSGSFNAGLIWAAKQLGYTKKTWVHLKSDTSRTEHANMASSTVLIDEPFILSGKSIMYPGDPTFDEPQTNCHCTLLFS